MTERMDAIRKWQERLESVFGSPTGIVGERVFLFSRAEEAHKSAILENAHGFTVLMDSFMDFALMTINEASVHGHVLNVFNFAFVHVAVQRLRTALKLFYSGYYFDAATHLRTVYEITFYLGAVLHGYFWFDELFSPKDQLDYKKMAPESIQRVHLKHRKAVDRLIHQKMRSRDSGLSAQEVNAIDDMFSILHQHVHYGFTSIVTYVEHMRTTQSLPRVFPDIDMQCCSIFCNTAVCASWTLMRVMPYLSHPAKYSEQWQARCQVLDEAFDFYVRAWEKPVGPAFLKLMSLQFTFDPTKANEQISRTKPFYGKQS